MLVLNGELYNASDLRHQLEQRGHAFRGHSDTEVALCAYEHWNDSFINRLEGMFAVAVWDPRCARLLLARDRLGIKPLYYAQPAPAGFVFASEVRALTHLLTAPVTVSPTAIVTYLATGAVTEPYSIIDGVRMLPPGHVAIWEHDTLRLHEYWSLEETFETPALTMTRANAAADLRELLERAVRSQMVSDVPLGVFLSGGLDSSSLVALAASARGGPVTTVSVVFAEKSYSEAAYIATVAKRFETDHHEIKLTPADFLAEVPHALGAMDQPTFDGVNTYVVAKLARAAGLTVVLSGLGGDELFAGYKLFKAVPRLEEIRARLPAGVARLSANLAARRFGRGDRGRKLGRWLRGEVQSAHQLARELFEPDMLTAFLPNEQASVCSTAPASTLNPVDAISYAEMGGYMRNVLLRDADVMSMAHGLEMRVPFLDERIVAFVASVPSHMKVARRRSKPLLGGAVRDLLPESIRRRNKAGFVLPFEEWLRGPVRAEAEEKLRDPSFGGPIAELLDSRVVAGTWRDFLQGRTGWTRPWSLYVLKDWGDRHGTMLHE